MNKVNSIKRSIFLLTGFMGAGKSFFGKKLSEDLGCQFVDLDNFIERNEGKSIKDIFSQKGEDYFRKIESKCFKTIIEKTITFSDKEILKGSVPIDCNSKILIIAAGGGFPLSQINRLLMKEVTTIFINTDFNTILSRLENIEKSKRPLLLNLNSFQIKEKFDGRLSIYKDTADYIVDNYDEVLGIIKASI